jgi:hypothetical protein
MVLPSIPEEGATEDKPGIWAKTERGNNRRKTIKYLTRKRTSITSIASASSTDYHSESKK